ncbi:MAG: hypothetical protein LBT39_09420 [Treponema sp.]|nr:hypothetical protein [Treponema sp.]
MESGASTVIASSPRHPYTKALLAASPRFGSHYSREKLVPIPGKVTDPARPEPGCPFAPRCEHALNECALTVPELRSDGEHEIRCLAYDSGGSASPAKASSLPTVNKSGAELWR